jgi:hypothetical protein
MLLDCGELLPQPQHLFTGGLERALLALHVLPEIIEDDVLILKLVFQATAFLGNAVERMLLLSEGPLQGRELLLQGDTFRGRGHPALGFVLPISQLVVEPGDLALCLQPHLLEGGA